MTLPKQRLDTDDLQKLYQYALVFYQQPTDAQDLLQAGVEIFLQNVQQNKLIDQPLAYVREIMRHRFIDQNRHKQRWPAEAFEEQSDYDISPVNIENLQITQQTFAHVWAELCLDDRDILYHWAVLGYSTDEACQLLDIPRGTFLSRIHRLRKKYRLQDNDAQAKIQRQL